MDPESDKETEDLGTDPEEIIFAENLFNSNQSDLSEEKETPKLHVKRNVNGKR